jgi:predicted metal-dependent hydrolase
MKSLWGSCNRKTGVITLNSQLFRAPQHCIDYVILHELSHYLYKNHDHVFYTFIAEHMPDWKERQKYLNRTIALV